MLTNEEKNQIESQIKELEFRLMLTLAPEMKAEVRAKIDSLEDYLFQQILDEMLEVAKTLPSE